MEKRIITTAVTAEDEIIAESIRPETMAGYIGQNEVKIKLAICIEAAKKRNEALDHVLLSGPPGLGKTTLAHIIANEMGVYIRTTSGPVIERKADLAGLLTEMKEGDVLFIDEIHRLNRVVEECLYPAMEDFFFDILIGEGPHAKSVKIDIPRFTLVGATTRSGMLTGPMRDRFGIQCRLNFYEPEDIKLILNRSARILKIPFDPEGVEELAHRSRRTPRVANRLLRRVRDYAQVRSDGKITKSVAQEALELLEIDHRGLDQMDRQILTTIAVKFGGGPVGLRTIAVALGEDEGTLEEVYEPFLIQEGLLNRTPSGRMLTPAAYAHIGLAAPQKSGVPHELFDLDS
ncbi:MAG: Holliday junction branch migration DNA helicase RuvB [Candidatus Omnitrophota bacterium]|jgi:Holliday junction DNA helicase RuvB|nr:MAG: Holliday junction branch migration DNA helicase RuvB [Candidatus Omnitrophota bacterium]